MTLVFTDGSTDTFTGAVVPDFRTNNFAPAGDPSNPPYFAGNAMSAIGEIQRTSAVNAVGTGGTMYTSIPNAQTLFENDFALPAADQDKTLASVRFAQGLNSKLGIFALSGVRSDVAPNTFSNNISVTASSTLDTTSSSNLALGLGALTMAPGTTLTLAGNPTNTVTFGATTLNGADVISPAAGENVTLGAITNSGGATLARRRARWRCQVVEHDAEYPERRDAGRQRHARHLGLRRLRRSGQSGRRGRRRPPYHHNRRPDLSFRRQLRRRYRRHTLPGPATTS